MSAPRQQWRDTGSGSGSRLQSAIDVSETAETMNVDVAYRALINHAMGCGSCKVDGSDCATAASLRAAYRDAKGPAPH